MWTALLLGVKTVDTSSDACVLVSPSLSGQEQGTCPLTHVVLNAGVLGSLPPDRRSLPFVIKLVNLAFNIYEALEIQGRRWDRELVVHVAMDYILAPGQFYDVRVLMQLIKAMGGPECETC